MSNLRRGKAMGIEKRNTIMGIIFALPGIIYLLGLNLIPIIQSAYYSLCDYSVLSAPKYIGFKNYMDLLQDPRLLKALGNTLYMVLSLPIPVAVALFLAMLLNFKIKGIGVYRTIFYMPTLVPAVAATILWKWIFNGEYGVLNYLLGIIGIEGPLWLVDPVWGKPALIIMDAWQVGVNMIIYLAALQGVPQSLYEASDIDGAKWFQKFWNITLPSISPVTFFIVVTGIIGRFQIFTQSYIFSEGGSLIATYGKGDSLLFFAIYIYNKAFIELKMGYASALAWVLFLLCAVFTFIIFKSNKSKIHYDGGEN